MFLSYWVLYLLFCATTVVVERCLFSYVLINGIWVYGQGVLVVFGFSRSAGQGLNGTVICVTCRASNLYEGGLLGLLCLVRRRVTLGCRIPFVNVPCRI